MEILYTSKTNYDRPSVKFNEPHLMFDLKINDILAYKSLKSCIQIIL